MATRGTSRHSISNYDPDAGVATCSVCGPNSPVRKRPDRRPRCRTAVLAEPNRKKAYPRRPRRSEGGFNWRHKSYGLIADDVVQMLIDQSGRCGICDEPMRIPCVDHDHDTGRVRGLLCGSCNVALGRLGDTAASILRVLLYIRGH